MAFICPSCQNQIPLESLLRELIVCDENGVKYLRVIETDEQLGECITCGHDIPLEEIGRDAIYCDENGVKYLQVKLFSGVEADECVTCFRGIPLTGLLRSLFGCDELGEPWVRLLSVGSTPPPEEFPLKLTFNDIVNVPVADASSVSDWNTFFDLPANGTAFTSVTVDGNTVELFGATAIALKESLFYDNPNLLKIEDDANCVNSVGRYCFMDDGSGVNLTDVVLPACTLIEQTSFLNAFYLSTLSIESVTSIGDSAFVGCIAVSHFNIPNCATLGSSYGDDSVFNGIIGNTITLTVPAALMTCNLGDPDGDIQYLQANNTVTIVTV